MGGGGFARAYDQVLDCRSEAFISCGKTVLVSPLSCTALGETHDVCPTGLTIYQIRGKAATRVAPSCMRDTRKTYAMFSFAQRHGVSRIMSSGCVFEGMRGRRGGEVITPPPPRQSSRQRSDVAVTKRLLWPPPALVRYRRRRGASSSSRNLARRAGRRRAPKRKPRWSLRTGRRGTLRGTLHSGRPLPKQPSMRRVRWSLCGHDRAPWFDPFDGVVCEICLVFAGLWTMAPFGLPIAEIATTTTCTTPIAGVTELQAKM